MFKTQHKQNHSYRFHIQEATKMTIKHLSAPWYNVGVFKIAAVLLALCTSAIANETPIIVQESTTTKLGGLYTTRTKDGQCFYTTNLGSLQITRDSHGNTWSTLKLGNVQITTQQPKK